MPVAMTLIWDMTFEGKSFVKIKSTLKGYRMFFNGFCCSKTRFFKNLIGWDLQPKLKPKPRPKPRPKPKPKPSQAKTSQA
jgi:hypothetical protein